MQLERTGVGDKSLVREYQVYLDEQRFGLRRTNLQNVGTTAGFPLEDVESDRRGRVCKRKQCRETVKDVERSRKSLGGKVHDRG